MNTEIKANNPEYLVDRYLNDLIRLALVYVKNTDDAEDIAQQVFLTYIHKRPLFTNEAHAKNWLFKVTVNKAKNHLRSLRTTVNYDELIRKMSRQCLTLYCGLSLPIARSSIFIFTTITIQAIFQRSSVYRRRRSERGLRAQRRRLKNS